MAKGLDKIKRYLKGQAGTRLAIIICAAVLLELIGIIQYYSMRNIQREAVERRVRTELGFKSLIIATSTRRRPPCRNIYGTYRRI